MISRYEMDRLVDALRMAEDWKAHIGVTEHYSNTIVQRVDSLDKFNSMRAAVDARVQSNNKSRSFVYRNVRFIYFGNRK